MRTFTLICTLLIMPLMAGCSEPDSTPATSSAPDLGGSQDIVESEDVPEQHEEHTVQLSCPDSVNYSCVTNEGIEIQYEATASLSDGTVLQTICTPENGETLAPGETEGSCYVVGPDGTETHCSFPIQVLPVATPELHCEERIESSCTGPETELLLPEPAFYSECGDALSTLEENRPRNGFPVGETAVHYSAVSEAGVDLSCTTMVEVTDDIPPALNCPDSLSTAPDAGGNTASPPLLEVTDNCDDAVSLVAEPAVLPMGTTEVTYSALDAAGLVSICDVQVTVVDAPAVAGFRLLSATLTPADETVVTLAWEPVESVDATHLLLERADSASGPWEVINTLSLTDLTTTDQTFSADKHLYRMSTMAGEVLGGQTPTVLAHAIEANSYDIRDVYVPGVSFDTTLYGVIRHPTDLSSGPFPLIVMLHGNHGNCRETPTSAEDYCAFTEDHECTEPGWFTTPNAEGYIYLADTLAAQGFVVATISGNALNCRDDYIMERAHLLVSHLNYWAQWNQEGGAPFGDHFVDTINMSKVGLMGHSRGGDAAAHVPALLEDTPIPGLRLSSIFSLAPTDFHDAHPEGVAFALLLPSCDGDVSDLQGMDIYDRAIEGFDTTIRSQVLVIGANHNYFNTEWKLDDNGSERTCDVDNEIGATAQRAMLEHVMSNWFLGTIGGEELNPVFMAEAETPESLKLWSGVDLDLRWSYASPLRIRIDNFSSSGAPFTNMIGEENSFTDYNNVETCYEDDCGSAFSHHKSALLLNWNTSETPVSTFELMGLDTSPYKVFSFRVVAHTSGLNTGLDQLDYLIRITDSSGADVEYTLSELTHIPYLYNAWEPFEILQTVRVPMTSMDELNTTSLDRVEFFMDPSIRDTGSIIITDLEFSW